MACWLVSNRTLLLNGCNCDADFSQWTQGSPTAMNLGQQLFSKPYNEQLLQNLKQILRINCSAMLEKDVEGCLSNA